MKAMKNIRLASTAIAVLCASGTLVAAETATSTQPSTTAAAAEKSYKPLAEARAKIGDVISDPAKMVDVMRDLSPEDQKSFVADVNAAIAKLPGSVEDKTAKYLNVNKAALKGASKGNTADVLAVVFATVPPESLCVLSECFANDLFKRSADPHNFTDAAYEKTARDVIAKVEKATAGSDVAAVRNTLAILMFVQASGGSPSDLAEKLIETLPDANTRELARKEWVPAATAEEGKSYDALLAYADANKVPDLNIVLNMAGPQTLDAMLLDITAGIDNYAGVQTTPILDQAFGGFDENRVLKENDTRLSTTTVPRTTDPTKPWNPIYKRDDPDLPHPPEPKPYPFSNL